MVKDILRGAALLLAGIFLATAALIAVCALPYDRTLENIQQAADVLTDEDYSMQLAPGSRASELDNFTDALMLSTASYDRGTLVERAMLGHSYYWNGAIGGLASQAYAGGIGADLHGYSQYWHGYMIFLKPLLMLCDYSSIRMLNMACQLLLIGAILVLLARRGGMIGYAVPVLAAYIGLYPAAVSMSLQFSQVFYVSFLTVLVMLWRRDKLTSGGYRLLFLAAGMATSFFDLLTYPLFSWGMPMALYIAAADKWDKKQLAQVVLMSLFWCAGYGGMWAGKWAVGALLTGKDVFGRAFGEIRTLTAGRPLSEVIGLQVRTLLSNHGLVLALAASALACLPRIVRSPRPDAGTWAAAALLGAVCLSPFVWYAVTSTHSDIHYWFTFRTMNIAVFALLCLLVRLGRRPAATAPEA